MLEEELASIAEQIGAAEAEMVLLQSRLTGLRAQRDALSAHIETEHSPDGHINRDVHRLPRTVEIEQIVCNAMEPVNTREVMDALRRRGRGGADYVVRATLQYLLDAGRVSRPSRGKYWKPQ